jgi:ABC-type Fe3+ transport system permease subunit
VIFTNALMAIPYALKVLENPMRDINSRYGLLCQSLGMQGWQRLKVVELRAEAPAGPGAGLCLRAVDWRFWRRGAVR